MDSHVDIKSCRICMTTKKPLCPLFKYKLSGNYAEMLTAIADVKVAVNDGLPDRICNKCCISLEKAFLLKTVAERSDKKLRKVLLDSASKAPTKKIAFDSFIEVKSEIAPLTLKSEPKWDVEVEILDETAAKSLESTEGKDVVIANTVIRKVDPNNVEVKNPTNEDAQITWKPLKSDDDGSEYLDEDVFNCDDDDDDYVPPAEKKPKKEKFKKPKLSDVKVYKDTKNKAVYRKVKVIRQSDMADYVGSGKTNVTRAKSTMITCYPILKNGKRGPPIMLKRPKDATILKIHPNYKPRSRGSPGIRRERSVKPHKSEKSSPKPKEKMVCPVCGILTYTLGNHMNTHQEKKKFTCTECSKTFSQKNNLEVHMKQHTGVKDHICEICGAGFYSQKSLVRHNLIHKGERPFACTLCTKTFIARCDLNRHLRIHSGYKPYKCGICTMSFNAKHQLQNHERMHTGERPYTCQVCNVAFSYKVNLNNHVLKIHGVNLKFKSIHTVTEEILHKELGLNEAKAALVHIMPHLGNVPTPAAHETISSQSEYS